jgi:CheY-like chemotaxis protein
MTSVRLLVVDDNDLVLGVWSEFLSILGYDVTTAPGGAEGLALFDTTPHDLVLTDLVMPGVSGWQVVEAVRQRKPGVPVIVVTGSGAAADTERAHLEDVLLLHKPVELPRLKEAVLAELARGGRFPSGEAL